MDHNTNPQGKHRVCVGPFKVLSHYHHANGFFVVQRLTSKPLHVKITIIRSSSGTPTKDMTLRFIMAVAHAKQCIDELNNQRHHGSPMEDPESLATPMWGLCARRSDSNRGWPRLEVLR